METFVVRIWVPAIDAPQPGRFQTIRGIVEDVNQGTTRRFAGIEELFAALRIVSPQVTDGPTQARGTGETSR
jgi:hypothetical protein